MYQIGVKNPSVVHLINSRICVFKSLYQNNWTSKLEVEHLWCSRVCLNDPVHVSGFFFLQSCVKPKNVIMNLFEFYFSNMYRREENCHITEFSIEHTRARVFLSS